MKKILSFVVLSSVLTVTLGAQNVYEAVRYTQNNYYGTARSVALGSATTALGGDLGMIGVNPAGSAVANYSQFAITPDFSIAIVNSDYAPMAGGDVINTTSAAKLRFLVPNFGMTYNLDLGAKRGLKNITFSFLTNTSNNFLNDVNANGINPHSSFMGAMASQASYEGFPPSALENFDSYYDTGNSPSWESILAYRSNFIGCYDGSYNYYAGSSENVFQDPDGNYIVDLGGDLRQSFREQEVGSKRDVIFNMGLNFSDKLYLGVNLGLPVAKYSSIDQLQENAVNSDDFQIGMQSARYTYEYSSSLTGVYGKFGFIYRPFGGLRIGGAIQTPTLYNIREAWTMSGSTSFENQSFNASDTTPRAEYSYFLKTPFFYNLGLAYSFESFALISVDWERTDYRSMRFRASRNSLTESSFSDVNDQIRATCGAVDEFRVGAEVKPMESMAIRAGYNFKDSVRAYSIGMGFSSSGSFFCDFAAKWTQFGQVAYSPYSDYLYETANTVFPSAGVYSRRGLLDIMFTFGWRF